VSSQKIFAANWKLHKTPRETREFFRQWKERASGLPPTSQVVFFPPAISLEATSQELSGSRFQWGAQNCYFEDKGAFTGENSPAVLKDLGARWALVGHSERRQIFGETDELLAKKTRKIQDLGMTPMLCVGELLAEREAGKTLEVLRRQLEKGLATANKQAPLAVAYEPVWAIGTGKVAGPEQVKEAHAFLREEISRLGFSAQTPILYGGSVKADNAKGLIELPHVNGFLVGGASLEVESFLAIANS
jgi:triosephosphate isomerase